MLCPLIKVTVTRAANEHIPTECYAHELPILAEIHGEDNLVVTSEQPLLMRPLHPQEEYGRISNKYGLVPEEKYTYVEHIYGPSSAGRLRDQMKRGMDVVRDMTEFETHDIDDEEEDVVPEGPAAGSYPWIKDQLRLLGVEFAGNTKKAELEQLLRSELCERLELEWEVVAEVSLAELSDQLAEKNRVE